MFVRTNSNYIKKIIRGHLIAIYISYCELKISQDIGFWEPFEVMLPNTDNYDLIDF